MTPLALSRWLRTSIIRQAAAQGIELTIDDVSLHIAGFRLTDVRATRADLPGSVLVAPEIDVETRGWRVEKATIRRADVAVQGSWATVEAIGTQSLTAPNATETAPGEPLSVAVEESRIVWHGFLGGGEELEADDVHIDNTASGSSSRWHGASNRVTVRGFAAALGPWRVDGDQASDSWRLRIGLDPSAPNSATLEFAGAGRAVTSVNVAVPRSPTSHLGIPLVALGLHGNNVEIALTAHIDMAQPSKISVNAKGGLFGVSVPAIAVPLDITSDVLTNGDPGSGLIIKNAHLAVGPLAGSLSGTVTRTDGRVRAALSWSAGPVPCNALETVVGSGQPMDLAYQIRKLAQSAGLTRLEGDVRAHGSFEFDSGDPGKAKVEFVPEANCSSALLGH